MLGRGLREQCDYTIELHQYCFATVLVSLICSDLVLSRMI